jgi:hypothetical protein
VNRNYLVTIVISANGARRHSGLQLSRDLDFPFKAVFVLAHKLREAMGSNARLYNVTRNSARGDRPVLSATGNQSTSSGKRVGLFNKFRDTMISMQVSQMISKI